MFEDCEGCKKRREAMERMFSPNFIRDTGLSMVAAGAILLMVGYIANGWSVK